MSHVVIYVWKQKKKRKRETNELIYKTETGPKT